MSRRQDTLRIENQTTAGGGFSGDDLPGDEIRKPCRQRSCPMKADASQAAQLSRDLATALRRLRRRFRSCIKSGCQVEGCPYFNQVTAQVQTAISLVLEEWTPEGAGPASDIASKSPGSY